MDLDFFITAVKVMDKPKKPDIILLISSISEH